MRKEWGSWSKVPRTFVGLHLFLEVRICNALLCSTKVFREKSLCVRPGKCSLTANERFVWFTLKVYNKAAFRNRRKQQKKKDTHTHTPPSINIKRLQTTWVWKRPVSHSPLFRIANGKRAPNLTFVSWENVEKQERGVKEQFKRNSPHSLHLHQLLLLQFRCNTAVKCVYNVWTHTFSFHNVKRAPLVCSPERVKNK